MNLENIFKRILVLSAQTTTSPNNIELNLTIQNLAKVASEENLNQIKKISLDILDSNEYDSANIRIYDLCKV